MAARFTEADRFLTNLGADNWQAFYRSRPAEMSCVDGLKLATAYVLTGERP
jgi:hypothetical protein